MDFDRIIIAELDIVQKNIMHTDEMRLKNRNMAIIIFAAMVSFGFTKPLVLHIVIAFGCFSLILLLFWQDQKLHRFNHGFRGRKRQIRDFLNGKFFQKNNLSY